MSPQMHSLLVDVAAGHRGSEVVYEILDEVRADPSRAHAVSQSNLVEALGADAVPTLREAWRLESDPAAKRWILGALGTAGPQGVAALPEVMDGVADPATRDAALFVVLNVGAYAEEFPPGARETLVEISRDYASDPYSVYLADLALQLPSFSAEMSSEPGLTRSSPR